MSWDVVREFGQREVSIPLEGTIRVDLTRALLDSPSGMAAALAQIDAALAQLAQRIAADLGRSRDFLQRFSDPVDEKLQVLPWMPAGFGREESIVISQVASAISTLVSRQALAVGDKRSLTVQFASIQVAANRRHLLNPIQLEIDSIELVEGSLLARIKGSLKTPVAVVSFLFAGLGAVGGPVVADKYEDWKFQQRIEAKVEGQRCITELSWNINLDQLSYVTVESLNYAEEGISREDAMLRSCNVQLALALAQGSPLKIDGVIGQKSRQALKAYASMRGVEPDIRNEVLRGYLARELTRPSDK